MSPRSSRPVYRSLARFTGPRTSGAPGAFVMKVLARKAGLDLAQVVELVQDGAGSSRVFELRAPMMAANSYSPPSMRISMWQKDMAVIGEFAASLGCPVPLFSATQPYYAAAMAHGLGGEDTAAVCAVLERLAGIGHEG